MNRKIQETDREFILARYKRDPHAFNARSEAQKYGVSIRTIYNVIVRAGIKMKRGRKPLSTLQDTLNTVESLGILDSPAFADTLNPPPTLTPTQTQTPDGRTKENVETAPGPLNFLPFAKPLTPPNPQSRKRRGPPAIHPSKPAPTQPSNKISE